MPHNAQQPRREVRAQIFRSNLTLALAGVVFLTAMLVAPNAGLAMNAFTISREDNRDATWTLNAGRMSSLAGGDVLEAYDNVEMRQGDDYLIADYARYYPKTNWIYISGNVRVRMGDDEITAESAEFNLSSRTGWLTNGMIFLDGPHMYMAGERINKHWGDVYSFTNAKITTCDTTVPAWSMSADSAVVEIDGYAQLWGTSFRVLDVPVIYSPFMLIPAKTERQTGFLRPYYGYDSRLGYYYNQPFFWAIDSSRDLTLNMNYMSKRGFMYGANYRSRASEDENLWLRADFLADRTRITDDSQGKFNGDGLIRTNTDRWWIRGMYDWRLPGDPLWRVRSDIDLVSDQDFLREYDLGPGGYDESLYTLFDLFSRDLAQDNRDRVSGIMFFRDWERAGLYVTGAYTQNHTLGHGNASRTSDRLVQTLPSVDAFLHKGRIFAELPLELEASAQAAYKYRREGTSGMRYDVSPKISLPLVSAYGSLIASGSLRSSWYKTDKTSYVDTQHVEQVRSDAHRLIPEFDIQASTEIGRVYNLAPGETASGESGFGEGTPATVGVNSGSPFDDDDWRYPYAKTFSEVPDDPETDPQNADGAQVVPGGERWVSVRHAIVPRLAYRARDKDDQWGNPSYDAYDRIERQHELAYSLENVLTRKRERQLIRTTEDGGQETYTVADYLSFMRLRLQQSYDIRESRRDKDLDSYESQPFSDIMAELSLSWDGAWAFSSKTYWSPYTSNLTRHSHGVSFFVPDVGRFSTSLNFYDKIDTYYERRGNRLAFVRFNGDMALFGDLSAGFYYDWPIHGNGAEEKALDIYYNHQCFQLIGRLKKETRDDISVQFLFALSGIGI